MAYLGDIRLGKTFDTKFCTVTTTGAPTTLAGVPVISAYPDNSLTQLTAGITLTVDFDGVTGLNNIRVVATSGNGYATATNYQLVITTGTVGGTSVVGYVVAEFSIEARSALMPATVDRTLVVDAAGLADANAVKLGPTGSGTAQTARDVGASVLLSSGSGTGQLDFTSGVVKANATQILGGTIPAVTTTGVPKVDVQNWTGTAVATPATAGVAEVNVKNVNNVSAASVTTVNANQGTTQPVNFTGTGASALAKADTVDWAGTAVSAPTVPGVPNVNAKTWNDLATVELPLVPTTAGRKLDVSAGGEAGVDWANVGTPGSTVSLSATTVGTTTVLTGLTSTTRAEPSAVPAATATLAAKIDFLAALARNKITQTATTQLLKADDGTTTVATSTVSDDGTTFTRSKLT